MFALRRVRCWFAGHRWGKWHRLRQIRRAYAAGRPVLWVAYKRFCSRCDRWELRKDSLGDDRRVH